MYYEPEIETQQRAFLINKTDSAYTRLLYFKSFSAVARVTTEMTIPLS